MAETKITLMAAGRGHADVYRWRSGLEDPMEIHHNNVSPPVLLYSSTEALLSRMKIRCW
jgi:hypothetical protein